jgi:RNA polymerase sigma-70 factor (ECF subfamily)
MAGARITATAAGGGTDARPERFSTFYLREFKAVAAFAYVLSGSAAAAEDLAQEAFLAAHLAWDRISGYDNPGAWVRRVVANKASNAVRRRIAEARAHARMFLKAREYESIAELSEEHAEVWRAVRGLPRRQAQVIALHYQADFTVKEIAATLGLAQGTVKKHLHDGRLALARRLDHAEETEV